MIKRVTCKDDHKEKNSSLNNVAELLFLFLLHSNQKSYMESTKYVYKSFKNQSSVQYMVGKHDVLMQ